MIIHRPIKDNTVKMGALYILITLHFDFRFATRNITCLHIFFSLRRIHVNYDTRTESARGYNTKTIVATWSRFYPSYLSTEQKLLPLSTRWSSYITKFEVQYRSINANGVLEIVYIKRTNSKIYIINNATR